ncbi:hypothetical protein H4Q26_011627 [Puccinia striiformis f. sp. tritici PST-130]|nr:hypothetical protein H4Q26_011627 [Puccinia striiformis f. sp. tritici PST-130]
MGITVCGKVLQAVSRDGSLIGDDPVYSILLCFIVCQIALFCTVSQLAIHITTISLLVFACINLAFFTLRVAGSPNFRPSFRLFSEWTALLGLALALLSMYLVGPVSASTSIIAMIALFVIIHYSSPAKQWGEVTQSIIYHQVRKYLLRLDERKDNVKYGDPDFVCGLYVLAHIIKSEFSSEAIKELQEQQLNWLGLVDISNIKAFVDLTLAPDERVGARQLFDGRSMTVRGMVIESTADLSTDCLGSLPTDSQRSETPIKPTDFVGIIEDTLSLNNPSVLTYGFQGLQLRDPLLGTILSMVPSWRHHHNLRVTIFCDGGTLKFMRAQDSPRGETSARATTRERASSRSESVCSALLDRNLLKKNDQPNIRIKALHPVTATGDDDDDLILEENDGDDDTIAREAYTRNKKTCRLTRRSSGSPSDNLPPTPSPSLLPPVVQLDFNSLPMHAQLICLNELIRFHSDHSNQSSSSTAIIFTSLPPPENGTSSSFEGSARYLDQLESFLNDLPPVLAIYAKQFTVTPILHYAKVPHGGTCMLYAQLYLDSPMDLAPHPCLSPDVPFTCPHVEYPAEQAVQSGMRQELVGQESSDGMYPSDPQITMKPPEYLPMEAAPPTEEQKRRLTIFSRITP